MGGMTNISRKSVVYSRIAINNMFFTDPHLTWPRVLMANVSCT
jgi:hypothetical protein